MDREPYDGTTVLVTGGAGAIGSRLVRSLLDADAAVTVLDDLSSGFEWNLPDSPDLRFVDGRLEDDDALGSAFAGDPALVFHLAAFFANQQSVDDPQSDLRTNGTGTLRLLQACADRDDVERLVYASSSCVYSPSRDDLPFQESDSVSLDFHTPYEITKALGEAYCNYFDGRGGLTTVRGRIFNSYGPGEVPGRYRNVIPNFVYLAMTGHPLPITGSGDETRDFTYVGDVAEGLLWLGQADDAAGDVFNLATGTETRIETLAETINDLTDNAASIEYRSRRDWDATDRRCGSIVKASRRLGYEPTVGLEEGLGQTVDWFEAHWDRIDPLVDAAEIRRD